MCVSFCNSMSLFLSFCKIVCLCDFNTVYLQLCDRVCSLLCVSQSLQLYSCFFCVFNCVTQCVWLSGNCKRSPLFLSECPPPQMTQCLLHIKSSANPAKSCHFPPRRPNNAFLPLPLALMPIEISHKCGEGETYKLSRNRRTKLVKFEHGFIPLGLSNWKESSNRR